MNVKNTFGSSSMCSDFYEIKKIICKRAELAMIKIIGKSGKFYTAVEK